MTDEEIRAALERHWAYTGRDETISHEIYHEDAVLEFPQSGERFVGTASFRPWRERYPSPISMSIRRIRGSGDFWVAENEITYVDGDDMWQTVSIMELRDGKVAHESIYFAKPFEAPQWRSQWADRGSAG
ncbi:MAG: nuclear transport factor 2 family protein [Actinomycetota bacterium]|nr:nuclear transport factor 2 family protein [Actinomycetota bacterium]